MMSNFGRVQLNRARSQTTIPINRAAVLTKQPSATSSARSTAPQSDREVKREEERRKWAKNEACKGGEQEEEVWWDKKKAPCCDGGGKDKGKGNGCGCVMMKTLTR
jgi:hypothetical protein